ncbi:MAG: exopolysaccharide biosynthesis protein [Pseudomonas sp.]
MTSSDEPATGDPRYRNEGIRMLLAHFTIGDDEAVLTLRNILATLQQSGFGVFLFVAVLPAFIPIPGVGGAVSGPLVILIGLQMLFGMRNPWLPRLIGERGPRRSTTRRFMGKIAPLLRWLDRLLKPRLDLLLSPLPARMFSGALIALTGLLLSLPIPFTNYLFGVILLLFALALLERDGTLMLGCWIAAGICVAVFGITSDQLVELFGGWLAHLR